VLLPVAAPGQYTIRAAVPGFEPIDRIVRVEGPATTNLEIVVSQAAKHHESVEVKDTVSPVESGSSMPQTLPVDAAKEVPSRPATVADALPLIPGITRSPGGGLQISGAGEHRSALLVNSADVTDPATGQFGTTVPIDTVQSLDVYQTSYLAEYGALPPVSFRLRPGQVASSGNGT
jgi:hypothetical protein